jgi:hypothetical protein
VHVCSRSQRLRDRDLELPNHGRRHGSTYEDITEQRRQDKERDRVVAQDQRRATIEAAIVRGDICAGSTVTCSPG